MAYADRQMSGNRITAFIIVALIHIFLLYALVTGLAYDAVQQVIKKVTTVNIEKDKPPPPPPPPPPKQVMPPPPVAPPVKINVAVAPPQITTVQTPPPPAPPVPIAIAPPAPVAPPPPRFSPKGPKPKGDPLQWVTTDDYPARALRENRAGTTGFTLSVSADGRVTDCTVASSSGSPDLDEAACTYAKRRARFAPATDGEGAATSGSYTQRVRWVVPKE